MARAAVSPPMPAPAIMTVRDVVTAGRAAPAVSGRRRQVPQFALRRPRGMRIERRVVAIKR